MIHRNATIALISCTLFLQACNPFESTLDKQIKLCANDTKRALNDPASLEIVSSEGFSIDNGWFRVSLKYTAKNAMGGRVRGETICGFKDKNSLAFNSEDFMEKERQLLIQMRELKIR